MTKLSTPKVSRRQLLASGRIRLTGLLSLGALLLASCAKTASEAPVPAANDVVAGGATTVYMATSGAFSLPAPNLAGASLARHQDEDATFGQRFVTGPSPVGGGLGPLYINASCTACHVRDGRGRAPLPGDAQAQLLLRLSLPGQDAHGGPRPVPGFGDQLQTSAVFGTTPEGQVSVSYVEQLRRFADGQSYQLRQPTYAIDAPYQPLPAGVLLSPRVAPPVFGLGLLEAVDEADVLALADESDANGDGISGRPNYVWDVAAQRLRLGRFGWKANQPTLRQQAAAAYNGDMGITSSLFPLEPADGQNQAGNVPPGTATPDITDAALDNTAYYTQTLGVPARRSPTDGQVVAGKALFAQANCGACHTPRLRTGTLPGVPEVSNQSIFPYTDLLLHDMGPGLADNRPDFRATGQEWRTPPLWGIGLTETVNGHSYFLHDGRARNLLEAVLWHGGEAQASARYVENLSAADRAALVAFLKSL